MKNKIYKILSKVNLTNLGLTEFLIGFLFCMVSPFISIWIMVLGIVMVIHGTGLISRSNDLQSYYEYKAKNG